MDVLDNDRFHSLHDESNDISPAFETASIISNEASEAEVLENQSKMTPRDEPTSMIGVENKSEAKPTAQGYVLAGVETHFCSHFANGIVHEEDLDEMEVAFQHAYGAVVKYITGEVRSRWETAFSAIKQQYSCNVTVCDVYISLC